MAIDLSQFHDVFFEESFESLDIMEQNLLQLPTESDTHPVEPDSLNSIFRAAHSIKGGSATFKFDSVANFTHTLETLLDEMRSGRCQLNPEITNALLQSVDCLREMLTILQNDKTPDESLYRPLNDELNQLLKIYTSETGTSAGVEPDTGTDTDSDKDIINAGQSNREQTSENTTSLKQNNIQNLSQNAQISGQYWIITFKPQPQILRTGNEPLRMFRELAELGELTVEANTDSVVTLNCLEPEECLLQWTLLLQANTEEYMIEEVFEWVMDECELSIESVAEEVFSERLLSREKQSTVEPSGSRNPLVHSVQQLNQKSDKVKATKASSQNSPSIRVNTEKVDTLINLVGELIITQSMLGEIGESFSINKLEKLKDGLSQLESNTRELQEHVLQIRMLPISFVFNRFPRMVRDLSVQLEKKVTINITGETTELDKTLMEQIGDPLVHLIRNAMDHGIELPEQRLNQGKPETGVINLSAYHQGGHIVIEINDDGAGINREKVKQRAVQNGLISADSEIPEEQLYALIFEPGFSTAETISDVSGRGVGMDVVKRNIAALGGTIQVSSTEGSGSSITIHMPLTLAILDGQLIQVGDQTYIIPLTSIVESLQLKAKDIISVAGNNQVFLLRDEHVPIVRLYQSFNVMPKQKKITDATIIVVEGAGNKIGLMVDELLSQQQVVIKSLESNFIALPGLSGATILGDGTVALIIDVVGFIHHYSRKTKNRVIAA